MKVKNAQYRELKMKWNTVTFPLIEGTPVNVGGVVDNTSKAIGLIPQTITEKPLMDTIQILIAGDVELADIPYELSEDVLRELSAINFFGTDGQKTPDPVYTPYTLPKAATNKIGGVKKGAAVANATDATDVITQLNALIASLVASGAITEYVEP